VHAAYQRLARSYHPDRVEGLAPELRELAHKRMVEINRAYAALSRGDGAP
jgi:curved DNA-binding protein CbpA